MVYQGGFYLRIPDHPPTRPLYTYIHSPTSFLPCPLLTSDFLKPEIHSLACRWHREESPLEVTLCYELTRFISHPKELLAIGGSEEIEKGREGAGTNVGGRPRLRALLLYLFKHFTFSPLR